MNHKKLVYIGFSYQHHGEFSGYDQIRKTGIYNKIIDVQKSFNFYFNLKNNSKNILIRVFNKVFLPYIWWIELRLIFISLLSPNKYIFHFIYGENLYRFFGKFKMKNEIVLTLHQPPTILKSNASFIKSLKRVDKIIVMSEEMEQHLKSLFPDKSICYIPHGVDTKHFIPGKQRIKNQILQIGNWLRDFELASEVYKYLSTIDDSLKIFIVARKKYHYYFKTNNNAICLSDINDNYLLQLFQSSNIVFLPLKDFTANNSIIEAMSCGCEVVIGTQKKNWHINEGLNIHFVENDHVKIGNYLIELLTNKIDSSSNNRTYVINNYDWKVIGKKTRSFIYNENL